MLHAGACLFFSCVSESSQENVSYMALAHWSQRHQTCKAEEGVSALRLVLLRATPASVAPAGPKNNNASPRDAAATPVDDILAPVSPSLAESLQATPVFRRELRAVQVIANPLHARAELSFVLVDPGARKVLVEQSADMTDQLRTFSWGSCAQGPLAPSPCAHLGN